MVDHKASHTCQNGGRQLLTRRHASYTCQAHVVLVLFWWCFGGSPHARKPKFPLELASTLNLHAQRLFGRFPLKYQAPPSHPIGSPPHKCNMGLMAQRCTQAPCHTLRRCHESLRSQVSCTSVSRLDQVTQGLSGAQPWCHSSSIRAFFFRMLQKLLCQH